MIKNLTGSARVKHIAERLNGYPFIAETDMEKYDASQKECHLHVWSMAVQKVCPRSFKFYDTIT